MTSGLLCHVVWQKMTDVSEVLSASIIRVMSVFLSEKNHFYISRWTRMELWCIPFLLTLAKMLSHNNGILISKNDILLFQQQWLFQFTPKVWFSILQITWQCSHNYCISLWGLNIVYLWCNLNMAGPLQDTIKRNYQENFIKQHWKV
jgi:hypothetical protein